MDILYRDIEGSLKLENFPNLEWLYIRGNKKLDSLEVSNCSELKEIYCRDNGLTELTLTNLPQLEELYCDDNNLVNTDFLNDLKNPENLINIIN
jgi:hypothetical protein